MERDVIFIITSDCVNILVFLYADALKAPLELEEPIFLQEDKRERRWFA